jgi:hypothetical protein
MDKFVVLTAENDYQEWLNIFDSWDRKEPFAHPAYCSCFENEKTKACCAVLIAEAGTVLYPFMLRDITKEPFMKDAAFTAKDIISPYGYGGHYIIDCTDLGILSSSFESYFKGWLKREAVVTEVVKMHLLSNEILPYYGQKQAQFSNIVVDLTRSEDELWTGFEHKVRKNVNKARRNELQFIEDKNAEQLDAFLEIYYNTMDRRAAGRSYYFEHSFFKKIAEQMPANMNLFYIKSGDKIISAELCLIGTDNMYSYLGGTHADYFDLRPNDLLKYEMILWGKKTGRKTFVMGGGYHLNDGIFKYKQSFAPDGVLPFYVGTAIFDYGKYQLLTEEKSRYEASLTNDEWKPQPGFVPAYRS